jgi:hypothetical protein
VRDTLRASGPLTEYFFDSGGNIRQVGLVLGDWESVAPDNGIKLLASLGDKALVLRDVSHYKPDQTVSSAGQCGIDHSTKLERQLL